MECFLRITDYESYNILACLKYAKSLFKNKKYRNCFELLQQKFLEHPSYTVFLYQYGKLCTKSEDHTFNGSAIGALLECLRICDKNRYGVIYYWLGNAHMLSRHQIEAYNYYKSALEYLDPYEASKIAEIHAAMKQLRDKIKLIEKIQNNLAGEITDKKIEESKKYAQEIKTVNRITGDI